MIDLTPSTPRWMCFVNVDRGADAPQLPSNPHVGCTPRAHVGPFGRTAP